jgi:hypothetical protein
MNRALPPGDCGDRSVGHRRTSRRGRAMPGVIGLVGGVANSRKRGVNGASGV